MYFIGITAVPNLNGESLLAAPFFLTALSLEGAQAGGGIVWIILGWVKEKEGIYR